MLRTRNATIPAVEEQPETKDDIRRRMRTIRRALAPEERERASKVICAKLINDDLISVAVDPFEGGGAVAVFLASPDEIDLSEFILEMLDLGVKVVAPRWNGETYELAKLKSLSGAKVYLSELETTLSKDPQANLSADYHTPVTVSPDVSVRDGDVFTEADITFRVISTPGHTEGSCCYYIDENGSGGTGDGKPMLFCGDTLFLESCGRTDMPTGSQSALVHSIREKLFVLPDETRVYPGHMDDTTIGHEKKYNYFV